MKRNKLLVIILLLVVILTGCGKKTTTTTEPKSTIPPIPVPTTLLNEAQKSLDNVNSITYNESIFLSYTVNETKQSKNFFYETNLSKNQNLMRIDGDYNLENNTVYIKKEGIKYVVYPEERVNGIPVKYELNYNFVFGVNSHKVLSYLINEVNDDDFVKQKNNQTWTYTRMLNVEKYKSMFDEILYHYVNEPVDESIYDTEVIEEIEIDASTSTIKSVQYDLTNLISQLNLGIDGTNFTLKYEIDLSNYDVDKVYFPIQEEFTLDDAPNSFRNYIYYYSKNVTPNYQVLNNQITVNQNIDFVGDLDIYQFEVSNPSLVNVKVNSEQPFTYLVSNSVTNMKLSNLSKTDVNYVKDYEPGTYFVIVKSQNVGPYEVKVSIDDKVSKEISSEIVNRADQTMINFSNVANEKISLSFDTKLYELSNHNYEVHFSNMEDLNYFLIEKYEDHIEYQRVTNESIEIKQNNDAKQYLLVSVNLNNEIHYKLDFIKK